MVYSRMCVYILLVFMSAAPAMGQAGDDPPAGEGDYVQLNLPETVDLGLMIKYVSTTLDINIIYDETVGRRRVSVVSPRRIRKDDLLALLRQTLKMADLELLATEMPGWSVVGRHAMVRMVSVTHVGVEDLTGQVAAILEGQSRISSGAAAGVQVAGGQDATARGGGGVVLIGDPRTRQIAVVGTERGVQRAVELIAALDVAGDIDSRTYRFRYISPKRVDDIIRSHAEALEPKGRYFGTIDEESGLLLAATTAAIHAQIEALRDTLDTRNDSRRSTLQFYKLTNTTAKEVLATIRSLHGEGQEAPEALAPEDPAVPPQRPRPPSVDRFAPRAARGDGQAPTAAATAGEETVVLSPDGRQATLTADENTNTIVVIAPPDVQEIYRDLIAALDQRRPQVLLEVTLVTLNTSDDYSVGVELGGRDTDDDTTMLVFSSFGLSTVNPTTGARVLTPGTGFNGILLDPGVVDVVIRALATDSRSRIVSAPKLLVNDNATGTLRSIAEEPFTGVNAFDTVATESFAGYASAGTSVEITPHISEGGYLQLKYAVELSNFTGAGSDGVPPPRLANTITSEVTIPDGHAVIVGGLTRTTQAADHSKVPILGDIPVVNHLFRLNSVTHHTATVFVFIRPVILADDKFEDLRYLSQSQLQAAELPSAYPPIELMPMR